MLTYSRNRNEANVAGRGDWEEMTSRDKGVLTKEFMQSFEVYFILLLFFFWLTVLFFIFIFFTVHILSFLLFFLFLKILFYF